MLPSRSLSTLNSMWTYPFLRIWQGEIWKVRRPPDCEYLIQHLHLVVALMDLGFSSHVFHSSSRLVFMDAQLSKNGKTLTITSPPNNRVYPPGPGKLYLWSQLIWSHPNFTVAYIFLTMGDVTSPGVRVMVGNGASPPVQDQGVRIWMNDFPYSSFRVQLLGPYIIPMKSLDTEYCVQVLHILSNVERAPSWKKLGLFLDPLRFQYPIQLLFFPPPSTQEKSWT
jgi:hypothetical protein